MQIDEHHSYSKYRDILPEASRVKCLAQGHNIWHGRESDRKSVV